MLGNNMKRFFSITLAVLTCWATPWALSAQEDDQTYLINSIQTNIGQSSFTMTFVGSREPLFTVLENFDPHRIIVNVAGGAIVDSIDTMGIVPPDSFVGFSVSNSGDSESPLLRLEFSVPDLSSYDIQSVNNNLIVTIEAPDSSVAEQSPQAGAASDSPGEITIDSIISGPQPGVGGGNLNQMNQSASTAQSDLADRFALTGYDKERISVDFFKIDLHNVFRLFRQISDKNIVVDEAVNGTITIALTDVPWDFAMDIILNLANLRKEERYNTIVIFPAGRDFFWPEDAMDNLSFEADTEVIEEETIMIQETASLPPEVVQAKELLVQAARYEKSEDYELSVQLYEQAFELWPENTKISNKLANLYLGRLNINARALYYAKITLNNDPGDTRAALYAAISSANMNDIENATEFFTQSVSDIPPSEEALISYAAFSEIQQSFALALELLDIFENYYGANLQTMISKARIYDKMGDEQRALSQYRTLLASGYSIPVNLRDYIQNRLAQNN
jgi:type IV pilus assembly protein PilQ